MLLSRFEIGILSVVLILQGISSGFGQEYPNKPIRIVTNAAGGGSDLIARLVMPAISASLGQPVIIDNRGGVILSPEAVSKAAPDGYTLLVNGTSLWALPLLQKAPYDALRDFSPISLLAREVGVIVVHPSLPVKSVKELIALAKTRPGELNYSATAAGTSGHLAMELFKSMAGINIVWVSYKGTAPGMAALISGEVQLTIADAGMMVPHRRSGRLRALAITSAEPSALAPGLPTVAASGLPGYEAVPMTGMLAPAKTPSAIVDRLSQEIVRFLNLQDTKDRFLNVGLEAIGTTPEQFAATMKSEIAKLGKLIKDAGIRVE